MGSFTVKQISEMFKTNEETVRRWIRSGKLVATQTSKKGGNVISSAALNEFIRETPKYASIVTSSVTSSPVALSVVVGGIIGGLAALLDDRKEKITAADVEAVIKKKIAAHEKSIRVKRAQLNKIKKEIDDEQRDLEKYQYALEHLDLSIIAEEMNNEIK